MFSRHTVHSNSHARREDDDDLRGVGRGLALGAVGDGTRGLARGLAGAVGEGMRDVLSLPRFRLPGGGKALLLLGGVRFLLRFGKRASLLLRTGGDSALFLRRNCVFPPLLLPIGVFKLSRKKKCGRAPPAPPPYAALAVFAPDGFFADDETIMADLMRLSNPKGFRASVFPPITRHSPPKFFSEKANTLSLEGTFTDERNVPPVLNVNSLYLPHFSFHTLPPYFSCS